MPNSPELRPATRDAASFLMGGSVPSASFLKIGASVTGVICEPPNVQQQRDMVTGEPKFWDNGDPREHLVVTLQTDELDPNLEDDDGRRRIYVKNNMKNAVADAVRKVNAKCLEVGGKLTVKYVSDGKPPKPGLNPPKFYEASYTPPSQNFLETPEADEAPMSWDDVLTAYSEFNMGKDAVVAMLKGWGLSGWNTKHTARVRADLASRRETAGIDPEEIPFADQPWLPA